VFTKTIVNSDARFESENVPSLMICGVSVDPTLLYYCQAVGMCLLVISVDMLLVVVVSNG